MHKKKTGWISCILQVYTVECFIVPSTTPPTSMLHVHQCFCQPYYTVLSFTSIFIIIIIIFLPSAMSNFGSFFFQFQDLSTLFQVKGLKRKGFYLLPSKSFISCFIPHFVGLQFYFFLRQPSLFQGYFTPLCTKLGSL